MQNSYPVFTSMGRQALLAIAFESLFWQWASRVWMSLQVTGTGSAGASRTAFQTYKRTRHDPTARKVVQLTKWGGRGGGGVLFTKERDRTWRREAGQEGPWLLSKRSSVVKQMHFQDWNLYVDKIRRTLEDVEYQKRKKKKGTRWMPKTVLTLLDFS